MASVVSWAWSLSRSRALDSASRRVTSALDCALMRSVEVTSSLALCARDRYSTPVRVISRSRISFWSSLKNRAFFAWRFRDASWRSSSERMSPTRSRFSRVDLILDSVSRFRALYLVTSAASSMKTRRSSGVASVRAPILPCWMTAKAFCPVPLPRKRV